MKNTLTILLLLFFQFAFAEKLIFTNNNEQVTITGDADINFQTGDISVTTVGEHEIINVNTQPVILGFYPSDYDVAIGANITVNWSVAFAESCTATVPSGNVSWTGSKQSNNGNWNETGVNVSQLPATLQLECENAGNLSTVETIQLTEQTGGGGGGDPTFNFFRVNSQSPSVTVNPPGSATVTWDTTDINNCTASASPAISGWSGAKNTSGSQGVTILQNTTMTMTCDGIVRNVSVTFSENSSCNSSVYPPGLTRLNRTYTEVNEGFNFGESSNTDVTLPVSISSFLSISGFGLDFNNFRRRIDFAEATTDQNLMSVATYSVSECPGDFTATSVCTQAISNFSTLLFSTNQSDNPNVYCILESGKTYYLNFVMDQFPYTAPGPSCDTSTDNVCAAFYTEIAQ